MLTYRGVQVEATYAEAFTMRGTRLIVTAVNQEWVAIAVQKLTGYGTSVLGCDAEVGLENWLSRQETPDGRPGASVLMFAFGRDGLEKAVINRVGQTVLTSATSACFNGWTQCADDKWVAMGEKLRYFGDGFQMSKKLPDSVSGIGRLWRIPVMDGEFVCEEKAGTFSGVAGGNLMLAGEDASLCLQASQAAVKAMESVKGVMTPFPGGIVRSGSKVGSRYAGLKGSTNEAFCPTLKGRVESRLPKEINCCYEIVVDGVDFESVQRSLKVGLDAAIDAGGIGFVSAGNYGGKLGSHHFHLEQIIRLT